MYGCVAMDNIGFRSTNDIIALFTLIYAVVYLYVGDGWASFGKIKLNRERLADRNDRKLKRQSSLISDVSDDNYVRSF
jgi:hypothetical protein